ncbi:MAG: hypothetical protein U1F87_07850 [Kiritimatiellia bacterium]
MEIRNTGPFSHDIGGHRLSGEIGYTFPRHRPRPDRHRRGRTQPAQLAAATGRTGFLGPYAGSLGNDGGNLRLRHLEPRRDPVRGGLQRPRPLARGSRWRRSLARAGPALPRHARSPGLAASAQVGGSQACPNRRPPTRSTRW